MEATKVDANRAIDKPRNEINLRHNTSRVSRGHTTKINFLKRNVIFNVHELLTNLLLIKGNIKLIILFILCQLSMQAKG